MKLFYVFLLFVSLSLRAQTVYISDNGKKFHTKNCSVAKTGKKGVDIAEARKLGFEACKKCKPDEKARTKPKPNNLHAKNAIIKCEG